MNIDVRLSLNVTQKYILANVENPSAQLLWGSPSIEWHKDIKKQMQDMGYTVLFVHGGGKICVLPEAKMIYVWGKSSAFGVAPFETVQKVLASEFPAYAVVQQEPIESSSL